MARASKRHVFPLAPILIIPLVMLVTLITVACGASTGHRTQESSRDPAAALRWKLPPSLEAGRAEYRREISRALDDVARFFRASGFEVAPMDLIDSVTLFEKTADARDYFVKTQGVPPEAIPGTFAGTVDGRTLYLVSRAAYQEIWKQLYPDWPWTDETYRGLIVHELAHRAHESIAISRLGSADAMGPPWFFEGLAVVCAGQFEATGPLLEQEEIQRLVGGTSPPPVSYPLYGRLVRSLAATFEMKALISRAAEAGFPGVMWSTHSGPNPRNR